MQPKVYIETSIVSYLTARAARDAVTLGHQQVTREWWKNNRQDFELYTSEVVLAEAERGDPAAAQARLALPDFAFLDMSHIAIATVHGMQFLLTWNCKHIANARIIGAVERVCRRNGIEPPVLCTPDELLGR